MEKSFIPGLCQIVFCLSLFRGHFRNFSVLSSSVFSELNYTDQNPGHKEWLSVTDPWSRATCAKNL